MGAFKPIWQPVDSGEPIIEAFGGLDLDYINERYRIYDPALGRLVEKPWTDIVNNRSLPAGRTYWDADGVLQTAAADEPVIEYDPVTGVKLGNRIWGSYGNVIWPSNDDSSARWSALAGATRTISTAVATPVGGFSNYVFTGSPQGICRFAAPILSGTVAASVYIYIENKGDATHCSIDYGDGTLVYVDITGQPLNTWIKIPLVALAGAGAWLDITMRIGAQPVAANSWAIRVAGAQASLSSVFTPYVETTTAAVTIPAESQIIDGQNFLDLWNAAEITAYVDAKAQQGDFSRLLSFSDGGSGNELRFQRNSGGQLIWRIEGGNTATLITSGVSWEVFSKAAGAYRSGSNIRLRVDGQASANSSINSDFTVQPSQLGVASTASGVSPANVHIRRIILFRKALPDSLLQRITQL